MVLTIGQLIISAILLLVGGYAIGMVVAVDLMIKHEERKHNKKLTTESKE